MSPRDHDEESPRGGAWGKPGGDWAGMRPSIDNPFTWSLPLMRIGGITVRIHLLFLVFIIVQLAQALTPTKGRHLDFALTALAMGIVFVVVLVHEFGHCLACRSVGGAADEILMWPLGGLAFCHPPVAWQAHLLTAMGGPLLNLLICAIAGTMIGLVTGQWWGVAIPNLLDPFAMLLDPTLSRSWAHIALYMINVVSLTLLAFNLLPMFPLDGGRMVQALLWPSLGWSRSMRWAVRLGYLGGLALGVYGAMTDNWALIFVAIFGLWSCFVTHKQLEFSDDMLAMESDEYAMRAYVDEDEEHDEMPMTPGQTSAAAGPAAAPPPALSRSQRTAARAAQQEQDEAREVDRILDKIAHEGIDSLTRSERTLLQRVTERKRRQP
jgi:Zn-dependent protease